MSDIDPDLYPSLAHRNSGLKRGIVLKNKVAPAPNPPQAPAVPAADQVAKPPPTQAPPPFSRPAPAGPPKVPVPTAEHLPKPPPSQAPPPPRPTPADQPAPVVPQRSKSVAPSSTKRKRSLLSGKPIVPGYGGALVEAAAASVHRQPAAEGPSLKAILPHIVNEQNRKTYGTWQRQFDFTRTIIGYLLGIHNFFRFPYLCYKFGGIFFVPYVIMMIFVGIPVVFMEFTIGQYCGVGSYVAFTHMAPILTGVSSLLTWSCIVNCWIYTVIMAWIRIYSNDSTSCLKGWELCSPKHYFNSPHCWTGAADDDCNDPDLTDPSLVLHTEMLYYNFGCRPIQYYCNAHNWTQAPGKRKCIDAEGLEHSIYERRYHATEEFFYGAVCGLQRQMNVERLLNTEKATQEVLQKSMADIRKLLQSSHISSRINSSSDQEIIRIYLLDLEKSDPDSVTKIGEQVVSFTSQQRYWTEEGQRFVENPASSSNVQMQELSVTTWIMIAVFLFEDLLKVSFLSYILNAVPFVVLICVTVIALSFDYSGYGIDSLFDNKLSDLLNIEMWAEAVIQVIYTTGVGNGVLISIATFNNFNHSYLNDLFCTLGLTTMTSLCGVLILFCSLGHYLKLHNIDVPFREYITSASSSSVEFCFIAYSHFLTLITEKNVVVIMFYFMVSSFATDTAIRLAQNVLDTLVASSPRLKNCNSMVLVAICLVGYMLLVPIMKNGGIVLFIDFEYFTLRYMMPIVVLIEIGASLFVYKATRILDNAEQMGVFTSYTFRTYLLITMYISFVAVLLSIIANAGFHEHIRFKGSEERIEDTFGWIFLATPLLMVALSVIKQLIVVPRYRWWWLLVPLMGKDRRLRRAFLRRIQGRPGKEFGDRTDHEEARAAAVQWRTLEAQLLKSMMERRKLEREKKQRDQMATKETDENKDSEPVGVDQSGDNATAEELKPVNPLLATVVRVVTASRARGVEAPGEPGDTGGGYGGDHESDGGGSAEAAPRKSKRNAFVHAKPRTMLANLEAAFMGRAVQVGNYVTKRHVGGHGHTRIVTRASADGGHSMSLSEEEDQHSEESLSEGDVEEKARIKYLNWMDYIERWPGRLDESDLESEGSTVADTGSEDDQHLPPPQQGP